VRKTTHRATLLGILVLERCICTPPWLYAYVSSRISQRTTSLQVCSNNAFEEPDADIWL